MPLTPAQVRGVAFSKTPIGKRGYHEDEVDAFLDVVETELARLLAENTDLRTELAQCDQQPLPGAIGTAAAPLQPASAPMGQPPSAGEDDYHYRAARVLNLAQQTANRIISQAQAEADTMFSQARTRADQLLCQAHSTAEDLASQATTRAETVLQDARTRADTVQQQSRDKLDKILSRQHEQLRQHTQTITALRADKADAETRIEDLRAFEGDYRTRVMRFLHVQLQQLGIQEPARPADPISAQRALLAVGSGTRPKTSPPSSSPNQHRWRPAVGT